MCCHAHAQYAAIFIEGARNGFSADAEVGRAASRDVDQGSPVLLVQSASRTGCYNVGLYMHGMQPYPFAGARKGYSADAEVDDIASNDIDKHNHPFRNALCTMILATLRHVQEMRPSPFTGARKDFRANAEVGRALSEDIDTYDQSFSGQ